MNIHRNIEIKYVTDFSLRVVSSSIKFIFVIRGADINVKRLLKFQ